MARLTRVHPTITTSRKDVSLTVTVETDQDETIAAGDLFFLRIEGNRHDDGVEIPTVRVTHANYMTKGVTRIWTLHVEYA